jgi:iron complex outermembrane receptor protein
MQSRRRAAMSLLILTVVLAGWPLRASEPSASPSAADGDPASAEQRKGILNLDIDQLAKVDVVAPSLQMEVSTVNRTESTVGRSPAAVFVVTNEMIRRCGARTIPDALRLVPGVEVARIDANKWAVSIRGFNDRFANKLLVQIDGRTCYTPLFAGVFWDVQDVVLEDVERIEVIRGPGATVWGANAVNGVINIITKPAGETQGGLFQGGAGTEELGATTARYGGKLGDDAHYRVYGKWFERGTGYAPDGEAHDDWRQVRTGMRIDWTPSQQDTITFQGDYYDGHDGENEWTAGYYPPSFTQHLVDDSRVGGGDALVRWSRKLDEDSDWSLQTYYDRTERHRTGVAFLEDRDTFDVDFQHHFPLGDRNSIIWGCGYRNSKDTIGNEPFYLIYQPTRRADDVFSYFVQDEITLRPDRLYLTVGSKFEHNDYTAFEFQPSVRLLWMPTPRHSIWGAVSRAVRTPSRSEDDLKSVLVPQAILPTSPLATPAYPVLLGNHGLDSEDLTAFEAGIRVQPSDEFSWDIAAFYNRYEDLVSLQPGTPVVGLNPGSWPAVYIPITPMNYMDGESYGIELSASYQLTARWRAQAAYTGLWIFLNPAPGTEPLNGSGKNPHDQFSLWLSGNVARNWDLDLVGRYGDSLSELGVPRYIVMDIRLAWRPKDNLELFVIGRNLLDASHPEFSAADLVTGGGTEVQQEVFGGLTWKF